MASSQSSSNASVIGNRFVLKYYTQLNLDPQRLSHLYKDNSVFIHGEEDENSLEESVVGVENISKKIQSLGFESCKVSISVVDCQESLDQGILVVVLGHLSNHGLPPRRFVQTFFLAPQTNGFYVLNDVLRYLRDSSPSTSTQEDDSSSVNSSSESTTSVTQQTTAVEPKKEAEEQKVVEAPKSEERANKEDKKTDVDNVKSTKQSEESARPNTSVPTQQSSSQQTTQQQPAQQSKAASTTQQSTQSSQPTSNNKKRDSNQTQQSKNNKNQSSNQQQAQQSAQQQQPASNPPQSTGTWANMASRLQGDKIASSAPSQPIKNTVQPSAPTQTQTPADAAPVNKPSSVKSPSSSDASSKDKSQLKEGLSLYVSNIPFEVSEDQIRTAFNGFGDIKAVVLAANKGYCFIEYNSTEIVQSILKKTAAQPINIGGRTLVVEEKKIKIDRKPFKDGPKKPREDNGADRRGDRADRNNKSRPPNGKDDKSKPKKPFHKEDVAQQQV